MSVRDETSDAGEPTGARELNVDPDLVRMIVVKSRAAIFAMPDAEDEDDGEGEDEASESDNENDAPTSVTEPDHTHLSEEDQPDATRQEAAAMIDTLNVDEQAEIIALTLIGRGDYEPADLAGAVRDSKTRANGPASHWLFEDDLFPSLLADGLERYENWLANQPD